MKLLKRMFAPLLLTFSLPAVAADRVEVTVSEVGLSMNTGRVFIVASPAATNTECGSKNHYAMKVGSPESYLLYSAALSAMNEGKKLRIQYSDTDCLNDAPRIEVFWNLNQ